MTKVTPINHASPTCPPGGGFLTPVENLEGRARRQGQVQRDGRLRQAALPDGRHAEFVQGLGGYAIEGCSWVRRGASLFLLVAVKARLRRYTLFVIVEDAATLRFAYLQRQDLSVV